MPWRTASAPSPSTGLSGWFVSDDGRHVAYTVAEMDRFGIERAMIGCDGTASANLDALRRHLPAAVIGLGDLEMGRLIAPSLSTIRVHGDAIGRTAAKLMLTRDGPRRVDLGFELVLRDSG